MILRDTLKNILIASDHAGWNLKNHLIHSLNQLPWQDLGTHSSSESVDYPDITDDLCQKLNPNDAGVLICGSGQGVAIRANRYHHIRAALCWSEEVVRLARAHNNANVICFGGRLMDFSLCEKMVLTFLDSPFEGGRHLRRVNKLLSINKR